MTFRQRVSRNHGWIWFLALCVFTPHVQAQVLGARPIHKIIVTNVGPQAISESLVRANIRVKEGDPFNPSGINDDVPNLYATGFFSDIRVAPQETAEGIDLIYYLKAKAKLTDISFVGNHKYSTRKLTKKLTSKVGEPLDERKLFLDSQEIKKMYQKSGYPQTQVRYVPHDIKDARGEPTGQATVTFEITESPKITIDDVYFEGAYSFTQKKLRKQLKTRRHWMFSWLTGSGVLKDEQLEEDREHLAEFYHDAGYIDFELKDVRYLYATPKKVIVNFVISEGARYHIGAIDFKGVTLFSTNDLLKRLKMPVGSIFTPKGLYKDVEAIQDAYGTRGYIGEGSADRVPLIARRNANTQTGTMDLVYEIEEGPKSYIEKVEIKGNTKTKDRVIRRELSVAPGEPFDMVRVKLSKKRLEGLRYFDRVEAQPEPTEIAPEQKNLVITVNEMSTGNFSIGAGYSSIDSILGFVEVTQGNFDLFNPPWFMGGGQKLRLRAQFGSERQDYELSFVEPWFLGRKLAFSVDLYHRDLHYVSVNDFYQTRRTGARFGLTKTLFGYDSLIGGVSYTIEEVDIHDVTVNAPAFIKAEEGPRLVSKIGLSLAYDTRSGTLLATNGQRTEIRTELAGGPLGAETDFYKIDVGTAWYFRGLAEGHLLEIGARTGVVEEYSDTPVVPLFDRFFLGGIDTLRGFKYREVGPKDPASGEPTGGRTYWFGSIEYSVPIIEFLRLAAFYDVGMVYIDAFRYKFSNYNDNYGFGIRLNIPRLGPLRLDYGIPIHSDTYNDSHGRFQFSVGYHREF